LYENQIFLTFQNHSINVWDFKGYLITSNFENHKLWNTSDNISISYITNTQDTIISFCKDEANESDDLGSINISNIITGKCISKINFNREVDNFKKQQALKNITALYYDEMTNEIFTGNTEGCIYAWTK